MSDESISHGEDKENLLYISKKINLEEFALGGEENYPRESITSDQDLLSTHLGSDSSLLNSFDRKLGPRIHRNTELAAKLKPFELQWSFGISSKVGLINLTTENRRELVLISCHTTIIYNYCTKSFKHLEGHQNIINCISADNTGQWLVTSDCNIDGCVVVWDSFNLFPVFTLFNIYPHSGVLLLAISGSARYLITIGKDDLNYYIDFWLWTLGPDKPTATYSVTSSSGLPVKICFNPDIEEHIMVVFQDRVCLLIWDPKEEHFSHSSFPQITDFTRIGVLTGGTYVNKSHESYVSSSKGCILVFRTTLYFKDFNEGQLDNMKLYINAVKVSYVPIGAITTTDGYLVVGDARGHVYFFDKRIRLLYWMRNYPLGPITCISFNLTMRQHNVEDKKVFIRKKFLDDDFVLDCDYKDITNLIEEYTKVDMPLEASLESEAFVVRDFFISTSDCNIYAIDFLRNTCTPLFHVADANVSTVEAHDEKPYIIIGYENGRIALINYEECKQVCKVILPKNTDENILNGDTISCIKYSYESLHLVCGRANGEIWILEPVILEPKAGSPFRPTKYCVEKIEFSQNSNQFAYFDKNKTVIIFQYNPETSSWVFKGKLRPHYEAINDILFYPDTDKSTLYTIGADRYLIHYNNANLGIEEFDIVSRTRIEQSSIPKNFTYYIKIVEGKQIGYFMIAGDRHKIKLIHEITKIARSIALGPAYGCFEDTPIRKMKVIPHANSRYMIFLCKKHIGLQLMMPDGNPYKFLGYVAHPKEVVDFVISHDGKYVFTFGIEERCVLKWEIKPRSVELMHLLGGKELEPFYCLLEGGKNGWLFQEIQDLFFYMQILQQEYIDFPRRVSDNLPLQELPELVRTCGYYPSEFEMETMMIDIRYRDFDESGKVREDINFIEFVKLFINHRPTYGYSMSYLRRHFEVMCKMSDKHRRSKVPIIGKNDFAYVLTNMGEPSNYFQRYLATLMRTEVPSIENDYDFLPEEINYDFFFNELLGIDLSRTVDDESSAEPDDNCKEEQT